MTGPRHGSERLYRTFPGPKGPAAPPGDPAGSRIRSCPRSRRATPGPRHPPASSRGLSACPPTPGTSSSRRQRTQPLPHPAPPPRRLGAGAAPPPRPPRACRRPRRLREVRGSPGRGRRRAEAAPGKGNGVRSRVLAAKAGQACRTPPRERPSPQAVPGGLRAGRGAAWSRLAALAAAVVRAAPRGSLPPPRGVGVGVCGVCVPVRCLG